MRKTCTSQQDYEKKIRLPRKFILTVQVNFKEEHLIQAKKIYRKLTYRTFMVNMNLSVFI